MPSIPKILLCFFLIVSVHVDAQERCGFDIAHKALLGNNQGYRKSVAEGEQWIANQAVKPRTEQLHQTTTAMFTIPVVVHVVHTGGALGSTYNPDDATIRSAIDYLNQVYNGSLPGTQGVGDIEIQFALAVRDPNCNPTTGIVRYDASGLADYVSNGVNISASGGIPDLSLKNLSRWDASKYYNIWVVNEIDNNDGTSGSFVAGYAYFPGASANIDGTVILATQMRPNRRTLPHELGHAFQLYHPFEGSETSCTPAETDCANQGDRVCDTDQITEPPLTCRTGNNPCTATPYNNFTERNYMNYVGSCANLFTPGQKTRMLNAATLPSRISLVESASLTTVYPVNPYLQAPAASCAPATAAIGLSNHFAGILQMDLAGKTVRSSTARGDNGYLDNGTDCHDLIQLQTGQSYTLSARLLGVNGERLRGWIDYNNDGVFNNTTEQIIQFNESSAPPVGRGNLTVTANITVPASAVTQTVLRMRLIEDILNAPALANACQTPGFGQAEDYAVFIAGSMTLPAVLIRFTGSLRADGNLLQWETASEQNTEAFVLQYGNKDTLFRDLISVPAAGSSTIARQYQWFHRLLSTDKAYYRLRIVDKDGSYRFSSVVTLEHGTATSAPKLLTNPVLNHLDLQLGPQQGAARWRILDMTGRALHTGPIPARQSRIRITEVGNLTPGVYILELTTHMGKTALRFVKG